MSLSIREKRAGIARWLEDAERRKLSGELTIRLKEGVPVVCELRQFFGAREDWEEPLAATVAVEWPTSS